MDETLDAKCLRASNDCDRRCGADAKASTKVTTDFVCVCDWAPSRQLRAVKGLACEVP